MFDEDDKFALLCVGNVGVHSSIPELITLPHGYTAKKKLPVEPDSNWLKWIGTIKSEAILKADLYISCKIKSRSSAVLNNEDGLLSQRLQSFYYALHISGYVREHSRSILLTGYRDEHGPKIKSLSEINRSYFIPGTPLQPSFIKQDRLEMIANLASKIEDLYKTNDYQRIKRLFHSFVSGINERYYEFKLHQFVRAVEGFVYPRQNDGTTSQMKSRTELFIGARNHQLIEDLYNLRSKAEHLHDVMNYFDTPVIADKVVELCRYALISEMIAKYCISQFLLNPCLWDHFKDEVSIETFWKLEKVKRESLWGYKFDISKVINDFDTEDREFRHT